MTEETSVNNSSIEEVSTVEDKPINNQSIEEISTNDSTEKKPVEVVANPEFISWKYPPYCELCNVHFSGEPCSKTHFQGKNHKNRLHTWQKYQNPDSSSTATTNSKTVLCKICWKEMNTQIILDKHCLSPAHIKEEKGRETVQRLKEEYKQLKEIHRKN